MANSVDPDQTALLRAGWSGSILFAKSHFCDFGAERVKMQLDHASFVQNMTIG